ncbi:hypothetical protein [Nocardia sp. SC052]|uniref:hypothetical protein n=1 Tax=Nocardia sichangensis TaxID=3385975 RepID=UPI0039A2F50E
MTTSRQFVKCETPPVHRLEGYSARDGRLHGSLDRVVYACADHLDQARAQLGVLTEYATAPVAGSFECGRVLEFESAPRTEDAAHAQQPQDVVVDGGRPLHDLDYAQRASAPMAPTEVPNNVIPAAALAELARDIEFAGLPQLAARARAIVAYLGYVAESLDQVRADLTMLAAHAPDVQVPARATGEQLLEVVAE